MKHSLLIFYFLTISLLAKSQDLHIGKYWGCLMENHPLKCDSFFNLQLRSNNNYVATLNGSKSDSVYGSWSVRDSIIYLRETFDPERLSTLMILQDTLSNRMNFWKKNHSEKFNSIEEFYNSIDSISRDLNLVEFSMSENIRSEIDSIRLYNKDKLISKKIGSEGDFFLKCRFNNS